MRKFLFIVVLLVLAWIFVVPSCSSKFGCSTSGAVAHADSADCPGGLDEAAGDAAWAAERIASIQDEPITTGLLYDEEGHEVVITTEERGDHFDLATTYLKPLLGAATKQAAGHVEPKAAALMRNAEQRAGVLVINNPAGPCAYTGNVGCGQLAQVILPKGSSLTVWWPGGNHRAYSGKAER